MTETIAAHFDGNVIVPDEPVQLPVGQPLRLRFETAEEPPAARPAPGLGNGSILYMAPDFDELLEGLTVSRLLR